MSASAPVRGVEVGRRFPVSVKGVAVQAGKVLFAAGDVRAGSMKRVAAAVGEGSSVIQSVHRYLMMSAPGLTPDPGTGRR